MIDWEADLIFGLGVFAGLFVFAEEPFLYGLLVGVLSTLLWAALDCVWYFGIKAWRSFKASK